ncbi:MAG: nucleotidyltransferase domain-containing protein [Oscillospiraceae bacterium]|jgi:predicted nucleotidyltransferase|nr:nucleotidyltransferase domain-containing protein [Oscillospiraceae bacterium]
MHTLDDSIQVMTARIQSILGGANPTVCLFGSAVLGDFRPGWSDIDIFVLTDRPIEKKQARKLAGLRQRLMKEYRGNPYFRLFEGGMLSKQAFFGGGKDTVVYWGTSGQRLADEYRLDSFAVAELLGCGAPLCGEDIRERLDYPMHEAFRADVLRTYNAIRRHGQTGKPKITACGWLLDIARGLYTLRTDKVIAKTAAGEWALAEGLAPEPDILRRALEIRREPLLYIDDPQAIAWCAALGEHNMAFADVLEQELMLR